MAQPLLPPFDHLEASVEFEQKLQSGMKSTLLVWFLFLMNSPWASLCLLCLSRQPLSWGLSRPTHPRFRARECITHVTRFFGFLNGQGDVGLVGVSGVGPCPNPSSWNPYPPIIHIWFCQLPTNHRSPLIAISSDVTVNSVSHTLHDYRDGLLSDSISCLNLTKIWSTNIIKRERVI